ncbi:carbon-nitrogen hydrolase family protein [Saccharothrix sp. BKS2]|uniref:carbon-nitrogen hydrolase family protein n=1 Tax=Saccharothrix sp. BKS2 TaxID=3064400 RepID=UPI0039E95EC2
MITVAVAQPRCTAYDVAANAAAHAEAVRAAAARVVVFPELSLTGYHLDAPEVSFDLLAPLVEACAETGATALAGAPVAERHIGVLEVTGSGVRVAYRKVWLGPLEAVCFDPGPGPAAVEVDGVRLGLAVCRDTDVPRHAADTAALGVHAYLAGVLEHDVDADVVAARARRIAVGHGLWVAVASFAGSTGEGFSRAAGGSGIWDPSGEQVVSAGTAVGAVVSAVLDRR